MSNFLDTKAITLHEDELGEHSNSYNGWNEEYAQIAIKKALEKEKYENLSNIEFTKYCSTELEKGTSWSSVCYLETKSDGFYFVMRDLVDHINVVYNRWD